MSINNTKFNIAQIEIKNSSVSVDDLEKKTKRINKYLNTGKFKLAINMVKRELNTINNYEVIIDEINKYSQITVLDVPIGYAFINRPELKRNLKNILNLINSNQINKFATLILKTLGNLKEINSILLNFKKKYPDYTFNNYSFDDFDRILKPTKRVTAIVSTYNSEKYFKGCLNDLVNQTLKDDLEIIIINSGSNQNEHEIAKKYINKYNNIKYYQTKREPLYTAWNRAINLAKGKYLTNANTDDRHKMNSFEVLADTLDKNPEIALAYHDQLITFKENETFEKNSATTSFNWPDFDRNKLLSLPYIGPQPMWRRALHEEFGLFRDSLLVAADYEWWLRIAKKYPFIHVPEKLGLYLDTPLGIANSNENIAEKESRELQKEYKVKWLQS